MLNILVEGVDTIPDGALDVESLWHRTRVVDTPIVRRAIQCVDGGSYVDSAVFIDSLGVTLYLDQLSTGAKAIIALHLNPGVYVDCIEVGCNALSEIFKYCSSGSIVVPCQPLVLNTQTQKLCDLMYLGYHFTCMDHLADYMRNGWGLSPKEFFEAETGEGCS